MKFFNLIRRRLIGENRLKNYLIYAFGEIILVVIGILIAIQLNDLKNRTEESNRANDYINQLVIDLEETRSNLRSVKRDHRLSMIHCNYINHAFWQKEKQDDSLAKFIVDVLNIPRRFIPNTVTIQSLVNSGNIELIKSFTVRNGMLVYLDKINAYSEQLVDIRNNFFNPALESVGDHFDPSSYKRQWQKENDLIVASSEEDRYLIWWPYDFEEVPYPITTEEIFSNRNIHDIYQSISVGHRITESIYDDMIQATDDLLRILDKAGY